MGHVSQSLMEFNCEVCPLDSAGYAAHRACDSSAFNSGADGAHTGSAHGADDSGDA